MVTVELAATYAGRVVRLNQADRFDGVGSIVVRISAVGGALHNTSVEWVRVTGTELGPEGSDGVHADLLVRAAALRAALTTAEREDVIDN